MDYNEPFSGSHILDRVLPHLITATMPERTNEGHDPLACSEYEHRLVQLEHVLITLTLRLLIVGV